MACYHPAKRFLLDGLTVNGKRDGKYCGYAVDHLELYADGKLRPALDSSVSPYAVKVFSEFQQVPCGQCIGCRIDKSREWANRMMMELPYADSACFITLTYNDEHLPTSDFLYDVDTGEVGTSYTLEPKDVTLFLKRLRRYVEYHFQDNKPLRYYLCGEYGSQTYRPHYHIILFNFDFPDRKFFKRSKDGFVYYQSNVLNDLWSVRKKHGVLEPIGYAMVADVTWETCAYCARYVTKKLTGKKAEFYEALNIVPEYSRMSTKPGLGRQYYEDHKDDLIKTYEINLSTPRGGKKFRPPGYFDNLFDVEYPEEHALIKENMQKLAETVKQKKLEKTSLSYLEMLAIEEQNFLHKAKKLKRGGDFSEG